MIIKLYEKEEGVINLAGKLKDIYQERREKIKSYRQLGFGVIIKSL